MIEAKSNEAAAETLLADRSRARFYPFGLSDYATILALQECLREQRVKDEIPDTWLVGEHPTVITQGARSTGGDLSRAPKPMGGIPVFQIDRGGMTTLHSPGQLIIYPIVKVRGGSLVAGRFARVLLQSMSAWLASEFGVEAAPLPRQPGLYVGGRKLMSIGISVRRGVSMHGIAMNLCNDLTLWNRIVPCGDPSTVPVSLSDLVGRQVAPADQLASLQSWLSSEWRYERVEPFDQNSRPSLSSKARYHETDHTANESDEDVDDHVH